MLTSPRLDDSFSPLGQAWRLIRVLFTLSIYFAAAPFGYATLAVISLLPTRDPDRRARRLQGVMCGAFRLMHHWLRWIRLLDFDPRDVEGRLPDGPCVVVANHRTLTDVTSIMATFGAMSTVVKPSIYRAWWLRPLVQGAGLFEGVAPTQLDVSTVVDAAIERLRRGSSVLFFPEGTRAPSDEMLPFGRTAFEIAYRAKVPVVPIVLHWKSAWLAKDCRLLEPPTPTPQLRMRVLSPVTPTDVDVSSRALKDVVETAVQSHIGDKQLEGQGGRLGRTTA